MDSETRSYHTGDRETVLDLTDDCRAFVSGRGDGLLHVFVPHATAGIAIMPAVVPPYATVPVLGGGLALGTWQSLCLVDLNVDNPEREVRFSFLG